MGKSEKTALGRALVKQHNQMVIQNKEKGRMYGKKKFLESVTEVTDIEAVIGEDQEEIDSRILSSQHSASNHINLDGDGLQTEEERREEQKREEALYASSLRVPRRPEWSASMTVDELDANERQAFLLWRRSLVRLEENEKLVLTPFEKNLDIWRQLWRVLERSDLLVMVVDARDPLFYRCPDLEAYACEIEKNKKTLLLVNKADLLPLSVREKWAKYFHDNDILFVFWSAKAATDTLEGKKLTEYEGKQSTRHSLDSIDTKVYGRDELLARLQAEAKAINEAKGHTSSKDVDIHDTHSPKISNGYNSTSKHVVVGFVGYPNVGKSSTINALVGEKRTGVTSTPGKTKHFQKKMASSASAATIACFQYQVKFSRGQICPLHKCPVLSGFRRRQTSVRCSTRVSNMAEFFEPRKLKTQVDDLKVRLSEAVPEPVKEIPWKKAKHMLLQRLLPTAERALKWSVLGMFIISSFSDVLFSISRNRELLIPFALFIGCMVADFLKETSQELFQSTQDARRRLLGISFFFVLVKVVSVYFSVGAGIFLTHLGNGGLIQVLWLWKKLHEKSESNEKEISSSFKESSTAT